mgnify:CR=1 FL=1
MKAQVTYFRASDLDKVFSNEEDRLAYTHVDGLVYLPRYPKIVTLPQGVVGGVVEATYMSIDKFISSPIPQLSEYAGRGINAFIAKMERDFYQEFSPKYRLVYSLFESHIAIATIYISNPFHIY